MDFHTANREEDRKKGKAPYVTYRHYLQDAVFLVGAGKRGHCPATGAGNGPETSGLPAVSGAAFLPAHPAALPWHPGRGTAGYLRAEPLLVKQRNGAPLRIVADADPADAAAVPRRDLAVSFSPIHRQYGFRPVREWNTNPPEMPGATEHDAMAELR